MAKNQGYFSHLIVLPGILHLMCQVRMPLIARPIPIKGHPIKFIAHPISIKGRPINFLGHPIPNKGHPIKIPGYPISIKS